MKYDSASQWVSLPAIQVTRRESKVISPPSPSMSLSLLHCILGIFLSWIISCTGQEESPTNSWQVCIVRKLCMDFTIFSAKISLFLNSIFHVRYSFNRYWYPHISHIGLKQILNKLNVLKYQLSSIFRIELHFSEYFSFSVSYTVLLLKLSFWWMLAALHENMRIYSKYFYKLQTLWICLFIAYAPMHQASFKVITTN